MSRTPRNNCLETPRTAGKLRSSDKVHCGSSLLQETHKLKLHSLSHAVEFHAKAALALHQKSNPVAPPCSETFSTPEGSPCQRGEAAQEAPGEGHEEDPESGILESHQSSSCQAQLVGLQIVSLNASFRGIFNSFNWCFFQHVKNHSECFTSRRCMVARNPCLVRSGSMPKCETLSIGW